MKYIQYTLLSLIGLTFIACYEQNNPIEDLYTTDGNEFPVISEWFIEGEQKDSYSVGDQISLDLRYWSVQEIDQIVFSQSVDGVETVIESRPYTMNFNEETQTDQMVFQYTAPDVGTDSVEVVLHAEIQNANGLSRKTGDGSRSGTRSPVSILVVQ